MLKAISPNQKIKQNPTKATGRLEKALINPQKRNTNPLNERHGSMSAENILKVKIEMERYKGHNHDLLLKTIGEYIDFIEDAYGFYNDTILGFSYIMRHTPEGDGQVFYGKDNPNNGRIKLRQRATMNEVRARNGLSGSNRKRAFQALITSIYAKWEHRYRKEISLALGLSGKKEEGGRVQSDMMGALRHLRIHIEHKHGIVPKQGHGLETIRKIEIFSHLQVGDEIFFDDDNFDVYEIIRQIKIDLDKIVISATGHDPLHRTILFLDG